MAGRAKENLPGGSLKYQFVHEQIRIFRCSFWRVSSRSHPFPRKGNLYQTVTKWTKNGKWCQTTKKQYFPSQYFDALKVVHSCSRVWGSKSGMTSMAMSHGGFTQLTMYCLGIRWGRNAPSLEAAWLDFHQDHQDDRCMVRSQLWGCKPLYIIVYNYNI